MNKILKDILFSFYLLISSVIFSVIITLNISPLLYSFFIDFNNLTKVSNVSKEGILSDYKNIIHYLNFPSQEYLEFKNFIISSVGEFHFLEVKEIFSSIYFIGLACIMLGIVYFIVIKKLKANLFLRSFNIFFYEVIFICISLLLGFYLNFSRLFTLFHKLFFNNDYWIFDSQKDSIINVLPESYFLFLAIVTLILIFIFSLISKIFYTYKKNNLINKK